MVLFRTAAWLFLLAAIMALTSDLTSHPTNARGLMTPAIVQWKEASPSTLATVSGFVQRSLHPKLWDPALVRILLLPTWLLLGAIGLLMAVLGRRKRRTDIFAN